MLGSEEGKAPRTYIVNLSSGAAEAVGPESFQVVAVSRDGKQLVGATAGTDTSSVDDPRTRAAGAVVILDLTKNEVKPVTGMAAEQHVVSWSRDDAGLLVETSDMEKTAIYRLDLASGKQTLLRQVDIRGRASGGWAFLWPAADEKSYVMFQVAQKMSLWTVDGVK